MLRGYYLERKVINEYEQAELISSRYAKQLRKEVNTWRITLSKKLATR